MSQVLTSFLSFQSAVLTSSTLHLTRTAACISAADITCACTPPMSPMTRTRSFFGAGLARWWRASRNWCTCAQVNSAATGAFAFTSGGSVEELAAAGDELVAARAGADELDRRADELTDAIDVIAAVRRQVLPAECGADLLLPPRHLVVGGLAVLVMGDVRQRVVEAMASEVIARADLQEGLVVEDVQPH